MNNPLFGANGISVFLQVLPKIALEQKGRINYPPLLEWKDVEFRSEEVEASAIFRRLINQALEKSNNGTQDIDIINDCELVEGMAVFMSCEFRDKEITFCRLHVIIDPQGDLIDLYTGKNDTALYFRLDYSLNERGGLFNHPFPHIHTVCDGAPRFPFCFDAEVFPPIQYLEFLMINFYYERWLEWALSKFANGGLIEVPEKGFTPEEMIQKYQNRDDWEQIPETTRNQFICRLKKSTRDAKISASKRLPKLPPSFAEINYY